MLRRALAEEGEHAVGGVVGLDPGEAIGPAIQLVEGWLGPVLRVEVAHPPLQASMSWVFQEVPVEAGAMGPFLPLAEFITHEHELLTG